MDRTTKPKYWIEWSIQTAELCRMADLSKKTTNVDARPAVRQYHGSEQSELECKSQFDKSDRQTEVSAKLKGWSFVMKEQISLREQNYQNELSTEHWGRLSNQMAGLVAGLDRLVKPVWIAQPSSQKWIVWPNRKTSCQSNQLEIWWRWKSERIRYKDIGIKWEMRKWLLKCGVRVLRCCGRRNATESAGAIYVTQ